MEVGGKYARLMIHRELENDDDDEAKKKSGIIEEDEEEEGDETTSSSVVMPGFRFHPTEEELVDFYLRRKVEGKRFNLQLITSLDLYRYDPWELPALAAIIGEKECYFYVPRDKKYRNGDRPNRVTTSGYWKATGADRIIKSSSTQYNISRSIGLKKTLVFYSGKAPKGIRSSWIMNEYRLPHHETQNLQKTEISLCRVYKRARIEDHPSLIPRPFPTTTSWASSNSKQIQQMALPPNLTAQLSTMSSTPDYHHFETSPCNSQLEGTTKNMNIQLLNTINVPQQTLRGPPPITDSFKSERQLQPQCPSIFDSRPNHNFSISSHHQSISFDHLQGQLLTHQQTSIDQLIQLQYNQNVHDYSSLVPRQFDDLQFHSQSLIMDQNMLLKPLLPPIHEIQTSWEWNSVAGDESKAYNAHPFK